ncbi:MAG: hypothetical protein JWM11_3462 [Planctomycetaceae bacterium]|nr:hypothetical protein [Planctomycetaceae bacterium]
MLNGPYASAFYEDAAWDDSEESNGGVAVSAPLLNLHEVEQNVWRELQQASGGHFSSLIVRRLHDGVCLQGVLETEDEKFMDGVDTLVKRVACVNRVLNQLVVRGPRTDLPN